MAMVLMIEYNAVGPVVMRPCNPEKYLITFRVKFFEGKQGRHLNRFDSAISSYFAENKDKRNNNSKRKKK